jgi:hypothetical protein
LCDHRVDQRPGDLVELEQQNLAPTHGHRLTLSDIGSCTE